MRLSARHSVPAKGDATSEMGQTEKISQGARGAWLAGMEPEKADRVLDALIWSGCIGVDGPKGPTYISDCGFRRPFIRALMNDGNQKLLLLHPTLSSLIA